MPAVTAGSALVPEPSWAKPKKSRTCQSHLPLHVDEVLTDVTFSLMQLSIDF